MPPPPNFSTMRKWEIVRPESGEDSGIGANLMLRPTASQRGSVSPKGSRLNRCEAASVIKNQLICGRYLLLQSAVSRKAAQKPSSDAICKCQIWHAKISQITLTRNRRFWAAVRSPAVCYLDYSPFFSCDTFPPIERTGVYPLDIEQAMLYLSKGLVELTWPSINRCHLS